MQIIPLGGVGAFGANATIFRTESTSILVDFGLMFPPDSRQPGVDYYIIDPDFLLTNFPKLDAICITHGHEDHIGALPFLLARLDVPVFTMPYTADLIRQKCRHLKPSLKTVSLNKPISIGDIQVEFVGVTHSIIQACALAIHANGSSVIHSGDFKVDALPGDEYPFQWQRFQQLGEDGIDLLIMDSTNAAKPGFCPSDAEIVDTIEDHIRQAKGRVFFTTFSSHMPRLKKLKRIAKAAGRKVVLLGRSFQRHYMASIDAAYLAHDPDTFISMQEAESVPDEQLIYVVTGSQGERSAVLAKLTHDEFQGLRLDQGDTVIFSSKTIPGNERVIALLISDLENKAVHVIAASKYPIHTSGHGYREDMAFLYSLTKARHVIPIHGEFNFLLQHYRWLQELLGSDQRTHLIQTGDVVELKGDQLVINDPYQVPLLPIDGNQDVPLDTKTLRDRKDMMYSGLIVVSAHTGESINVEIATHGLAEKEPGLLASEMAKTLTRVLSKQRAADPHAILKRESKKFLKTKFFGRPLIKIIVDGHM